MDRTADLVGTSIDLSGLKRDGYQILRGVLSSVTIASVRGFLEESLRGVFEMLAPWDIRDGDPKNGLKVASILAKAGPGELPDDVRSIMMGHFPLATRLSERLWTIPRDGLLRAVLDKAFDGAPLFMHMPPTARFVLPSNMGAAVPAHQDASYNQHIRDFLTVWVPFVEIDELCGGMAVFEGSQDERELTDDVNYTQWRAAISTDGYRKRSCRPMSPGDAIIFNKSLIHESQPNVSTRTRLSVDLRFFPDTIVSGKHALDLQTWRVLPPGQSGPKGNANQSGAA